MVPSSSLSNNFGIVWVRSCFSPVSVTNEAKGGDFISNEAQMDGNYLWPDLDLSCDFYLLFFTSFLLLSLRAFHYHLTAPLRPWLASWAGEKESPKQPHPHSQQGGS